MKTIAENAIPIKGARSINVDKGERVCVNCERYELYYRKNRGNVVAWIPTDSGYCTLHDRKRGPLVKPCKNFKAHT